MNCGWKRPPADGSVPEMTSTENITRVRVQYAKGASLRFTGHLDLQRIWERLLRRTKLPVRYSQGFHPRARLNLASALPLGFISEAELLDFWMDEPLPIEEINSRLMAATPPGLTIHSVKMVSMQEDALQSQMTSSEFEITFFNNQDTAALQEKVGELLAQPEIIRTRREKTYDLRPLILNLKVLTLAEEETGVWMRLNADPGATGRPDEVMSALGYTNTDYLVRRIALILNQT